MLINESVRLQNAIGDIIDRIKLVDQALDAEIFAFVQRSRAERTARRKQIAEAHATKQRYSNKVLLYRVNKGSLELSWSSIYYIKGSSSIRYKRLAASRGAVHLARLRSGAHEDEVELITEHEALARAYRKLYAQHAKSKRAANQLQKVYNTLTGSSLKAATQGEAVSGENDSKD